MANNLVNTTRSSSPFNAFWGWGISTLLLWLLNGNNDSSDSGQEASKNTNDYTNQIGSPVPVVLGRAMIKNPLVSFYGDFRADPYTEEYGMHTGIDWSSVIPIIVLGIIAICSSSDKVVVKVVAPVVGGGGGVAKGVSNGVTIDSGAKRAAILNVIVSVLLWLMTQLFMMHMGRTTIQKGFKYYLGWQHILCWTGEFCGIKKIWMNVYDSHVEDSTETGVWDNDNRIAWKFNNKTGMVAHINNENMFGGVDEGGGFVGDVRFYFGTQEQANDPWMVEQMTKSENVPAELKGLTPKYPMYMTCVIPQAYIGKQATIPEMWFEVVNYPNRMGLGKIDDDANPAEAIYEILKNEYWGCGYSDDRIDVDSLRVMGKTLLDEKIGISCQITSLDTASSYINNILNHVNGVCYDDPKTGKITFKLIRPDYNAEDLSIFSIDNCANMSYTRLDWSETSSTVTATYTDANNKYESEPVTITDTANVKITNNYNEKKLDAPYYTTADNIRTYVKTQLLSVAYPLSTISFDANRDAYDLTVGQPILVNWEPYGITQQVYRVTDIDYGGLKDGKIPVTAIEDIFGFDKTDYGFSHGTDWIEPAHLPEDIFRYMFVEMPYELTRSLDTYVYAYGARPTEYTTYWDVWRYVGGNYTRTAQSSMFSTVARMVYGCAESYVKDLIGFEVSAIGSNGTELIDDKIERINNDLTYYTSTSGQNLIFCDNEIMSYDRIDKLPNGNYQIVGVIRGIYDTIPQVHTAESILFFTDAYQNVNVDNPVCLKGSTSNEKLELTSETLDGTQNFDVDKITFLDTKRRSESPSIMANLKFSADMGTEIDYNYNYPATKIFSGDLLFTFNPRNKYVGNSILEQTDSSSISVSSTTDNVIQVISNNVTFDIKTDGGKDVGGSYESYTSMSFKWAEFCSNMNNKVSLSNSVVIRVYTYNRDAKLNSYESYEKSINYAIPRMVGVVATESDVQSYANSVSQLTMVVVPGSTVAPSLTVSYDECPLIFVGSKSSTGILAQDGNKYDLSSLIVYRIDGYNNGASVIHKIDIDAEYIFRSNFTTHNNNTIVCYRYRSGNWVSYTPY